MLQLMYWQLISVRPTAGQSCKQLGQFVGTPVDFVLSYGFLQV
jgi:hypothetical protein